MRGATILTLAVIAVAVFGLTEAAYAQADGTVLTTLENSMSQAAKGWEDRLLQAARSLFWILAGIEFGIAAVWLAIAAPSLDSWFAELVRRIIFIGFFLFVLQTGPQFAQDIVTSLFQIGAGGGEASPANTFNAGINVASALSEHIKVGLFEDNVGAIAAVFACILVIVSFALVSAIFVSVLVEMYVGLLAGMIMLGLGGSSFTKDFAIKYLVYAFSVGMKLMALVMIASIGSQTLISLSQAPPAGGEQWLNSVIVGGLSVVVFIIAMYVPNIMQGVVQGVSVGNGMEAIRSGAQVASFGASMAAGAGAGFGAAQAARASGAGILGSAMAGVSTGGKAMTATALNKALGMHGMGAGGTVGSGSMGLSNPKTDGKSGKKN